MIEEVQAHRAGGLGKIPGEGPVGSAWIDLTRRVIVRDGKVGGLVDDDGAEDFGNGGDGLV